MMRKGYMLIYTAVSSHPKTQQPLPQPPPTIQIISTGTINYYPMSDGTESNTNQAVSKKNAQPLATLPFTVDVLNIHHISPFLNGSSH
mmetsp:Transcript_3540/g.5380  ORF Transcript_3540/g.5380 Transcript_3540/m.5380 type:complete len:88 (+) Transcript_3540:130-393(+)